MRAGAKTTSAVKVSTLTDEIEVGESIVPQSKYTKLLGMQVEDSLKWTEHIDVTIKALNMRLYQIGE